jgi:tRNA 2-thiocytidine biosynthesis protein TtcA
MKGMPPKLVSDDGRNVVIRPLAYVKESDLERWAEHRAFPIIPCNLCGSQPNLQRATVKAMLQDWDRRFPGRVDNMFTAMGNIVTSHMMDRKLFPFETIQATGAPVADGDIAFDEDEQCGTPAPATGVVNFVRPGQVPAPVDDAGEAYSASED